MRSFLLPAALALTLSPFAALAQDSGAPAVPGVSTGTVEGAPAAGAEGGPGTAYLKSAHEAWSLLCVKVAEGTEPCVLSQRGFRADPADGQQKPVAELNLFPLPAGGPAVLGANFIAPLGTLLTENLRLQIDEGAVKVYPFSWCDTEGCVARVGLTAEEVEAMKKGSTVTATLYPVEKPEEKVALALSLKGFTAGFDALLAASPPPTP